MACCVLAMAFIAQLFALRRKVRRLLGLPVGDWYEEAEPQAGVFAGLGAKLRGLLRNRAARAVLAALVLGELTFAAVAAPGDSGLVAEHRAHVRAAWEYVQSFGSFADISSLWCSPSQKSPPPPAPAR